MTETTEDQQQITDMINRDLRGAIKHLKDTGCDGVTIATLENCFSHFKSQLSNRDKEIKEIKELKEKLSCPDHYYDPFDWEYTLPIGDKEYLKDHLDTQPDSYIVEIATLINGPRRFYVAPDDDVFFNSEQEALASLQSKEGEEE